MTSPDVTSVRHVSQLLPEAVKRRAQSDYAVCNGRRLSVGELAGWVDLVAMELHRRGVRSRDRVLVMMPNSLEVVVAQLAAWRLGAVALPVVAMFRRHELTHILGEATPKVIFTDATMKGRQLTEEFENSISDAGITPLAKFALGASTDGWDEFPEFGAPSAAHLPLVEAGPDEECLVLYTSGTTSAPKGARLSTRAIVSATGAYDRLGLDATDVALVMGPLAHIAGMITGCLLPLRIGARAVILPRWDAEVAVALIDSERVTFSTGPNLFLREIVTAYETNSAPGAHRLRIFAVGAAPTPPSLVERAERQGIKALRCYGMTETAGSITMADPDGSLELRANFDGQLAEDVNVRIVDELGRELPFSHEGNIQISGPQLFLGYIDPVATREQLRDGWFDPGDVGFLTADGWLSITGRTKDIINRGGEKLSAREIEEAVLKHPAVDNVAVVGVPHERFGEVVCAFVTLRQNAGWPGDQALAEFLDDLQLAKVKIPVEWHVLDEIPTTATGKVKKNALFELRGRVKHA